MDHWATISADFPTNGRKVKILSHKGLFFAASRCLPHERTFSRDPVGPRTFDTSGAKIFSFGLTFTPLKFGICEGNFQPSGWELLAHWTTS